MGDIVKVDRAISAGDVGGLCLVVGEVASEQAAGQLGGDVH